MSQIEMITQAGDEVSSPGRAVPSETLTMSNDTGDAPEGQASSSCHACGTKLERKESMSNLTDAVARRLKELCSTCLSHTWTRTELISVEQIHGGLTNYLYVCWLDDSVVTREGEPRKVLIRIYGEVLRENLDSRVLDSVIFALLSEKKYGPKLHGVFEGGRIEEYVESRVLNVGELSVPEISSRIAEHLATLHCLDMPLTKRPQFVFSTMNKWLMELQQEPPGNVTDQGHSIPELIRDLRLSEEVAWIRSAFMDSDPDVFPVVFGHNDVHENNILYFKDETAPHGFKLLPIDFEYCSYNFRGFDFGNHFNEWTFDYTVSEWPCYSYKPPNYPTKEQQLLFLRAYLTAGNVSADEDSLLRECDYGAALSHIFWAVWSLIQCKLSSIKFGFMEYAICRFDAYKEMKSRLPPLPPK